MNKIAVKFLFLLVIFSGIGSNPKSVRATISSAIAQQSSSQELYERGFEDFEDREYHQAIENFLALLKVEPDSDRAYNMIGMSFGELEEYPAAIAAFDKAIALNADFANAYYNRGYAYKELGRFDLAQKDFDRTLELTAGEHISALINRSIIYALRENYPEAIADLTQVVKLKPDEAIAYYNRALVNLTIGNKTAYIRDLTTAEKLYYQAGDRAGLAQIEKVKEFDY